MSLASRRMAERERECPSPSAFQRRQRWCGILSSLKNHVVGNTQWARSKHAQLVAKRRFHPHECGPTIPTLEGPRAEKYVARQAAKKKAASQAGKLLILLSLLVSSLLAAPAFADSDAWTILRTPDGETLTILDLGNQQIVTGSRGTSAQMREFGAFGQMQRRTPEGTWQSGTWVHGDSLSQQLLSHPSTLGTQRPWVPLLLSPPDDEEPR